MFAKLSQCESLESRHWASWLLLYFIFQSLPARKHEVVRNSVSKVTPQGWSLTTMMLYRLATTICTMQNLQYVRGFVRKQYYLHTVARMDKYQNYLQRNASQKSHDLNKKVLWRFLPFQLEWIKVDLIVFWHADANSQPQSVIREGRHSATDILTWHPGRVEVDINSSEFLESNVPHPVYCTAFAKCAMCLTAVLVLDVISIGNDIRGNDMTWMNFLQSHRNLEASFPPDVMWCV